MGPAAVATTLSRTTAAVNKRFVGLMAGRGAPAGLVPRDEPVDNICAWGREGRLLVGRTFVDALVVGERLARWMFSD